MAQDFYMLDNEKIDLIECYDSKRYTPSRIKRELLTAGIEPEEYTIITAYAIYWHSNELEFILHTDNKARQKLKLAIRNYGTCLC